MFSNLFFEVVGWISVLYAIASGIVAGSTFLLYIVLRFPPAVRISHKMNFALTAGILALLGTVFFAGQISYAFLNDPFWPRALGRYVLWLIFSIAVGLGLSVSRSFAHRREP